jgi:hypothetical protein
VEDKPEQHITKYLAIPPLPPQRIITIIIIEERKK